MSKESTFMLSKKTILPENAANYNYVSDCHKKKEEIVSHKKYIFARCFINIPYTYYLTIKPNIQLTSS